MSERPDAAELITRARVLTDASDHAAVVALLGELPRVQLLREPQLGYHLAYSCRRVGRGREVLELVEELEHHVQRSGLDWLVRRRVNLEAMLHYDRGDLERAELRWEEVVAHASGAGDREMLAAAYNNLGVIHTLRDAVDHAVAAYQRALTAWRELGDARGAAQAHCNLAILLRELGRRADAESHFEQATQLARTSGSEDVLGRVEEEQAVLQLATGDAEFAAASARRALHRFSRIRDLSGQGEAERVLGIVLLRERRLAAARERLERALGLAEQSGNQLLDAETREAMAVLADLEGAAELAEEHRQAAARLFSAMRAEPWGRRMREGTTALARLG
jgi:tetratricopeptide (TPR) repeat protein